MAPLFTRVSRTILCLTICGLVSSPLWARKPNWLRVTSPHFVMYTDLGQSDARKTLLEFERMHAVFEQRVLQGRGQTSTPLYILAFRNNKEMKQHLPLWHGKPITAAGIFIPGRDRNFILVDGNQYGDGQMESALHEYTHSVLRDNFSPIPLWMNEGLAEYYSSLDLRYDNITLGEPPRGLVYVLQHSSFLPLDQLFSVTSNSPMYNDDHDHRNVFYAESWLAIHFFIDNSELPQLSRFVALQGQSNGNIDGAIQVAFAESSKQLTRDLIRYFASGRIYVSRTKLKMPMRARDFQVEPVSAEQAQTVQADCDGHVESLAAKGTAELEQILKQDPANTAAAAALGAALIQQGRSAEAVPILRQAVNRQPADFRPYYEYAFSVRQSSPSRANVRTLVPVMRKAVQLNPHFAFNYDLLAWAETYSGDTRQGVADAKHALTLSPGNEQLLSDLGSIAFTARQWDLARLIFTNLLQSRHPQYAAFAKAQLQVLTRYQNMVTHYRPVQEHGAAHEGSQITILPPE